MLLASLILSSGDDDGGARVSKNQSKFFFVIYGMRYKEEPLLNNSIFCPMGDLFFYMFTKYAAMLRVSSEFTSAILFRKKGAPQENNCI